MGSVKSYVASAFQGLKKDDLKFKVNLGIHSEFHLGKEKERKEREVYNVQFVK